MYFACFLFIYLYNYLFICLFIYLFTYLFIYLFIYFIYLFIYLFISLSIKKRLTDRGQWDRKAQSVISRFICCRRTITGHSCQYHTPWYVLFRTTILIFHNTVNIDPCTLTYQGQTNELLWNSFSLMWILINRH